MKKYLILAPYSEQSLSIAKLLRESACPVIGGLLSKKRKEWFSKYYDDCITFCEDDLRSLSEVYTIVPTTAKTTQAYFEHFDTAVINDVRLTKRSMVANNKVSMLELVKTIGIPIPTDYGSPDDVKSYPVFFKEKFEKGGGIRGLARARKDLMDRPVDRLLFQEYIKGDSTFGVGFLATDGKIIHYFSHEEKLSIPKLGGSAVVIREHNDDRLLQYTSKIVKNIGYSGWGLAEFKYCPKRDDYVFMEVNAKFWASCEFSFLKNRAMLNALFPEVRREQSKKLRGAVFVDRLVQLGIGDIIRSSHYLLYFKPVRYRNWAKLLLMAVIPKVIFVIVRKIKCRSVS